MTQEEMHQQFLKFYAEATDFVTGALNDKMATGDYKIPPEIISMAMVQLGVAAMEDIMGTEKTIMALEDLVNHIKSYYEKNKDKMVNETVAKPE